MIWIDLVDHIPIRQRIQYDISLPANYRVCKQQPRHDMAGSHPLDCYLTFSVVAENSD